MSKRGNRTRTEPAPIAARKLAKLKRTAQAVLATFDSGAIMSLDQVASALSVTEDCARRLIATVNELAGGIDVIAAVPKRDDVYQRTIYGARFLERLQAELVPA